MNFFRESSKGSKSNVRFLHAVGNAPNVDVYINGAIISENLAFSKLSQYNTLSSGDYDIEIFSTGTSDSPLLTRNITLSPGSSYTIPIVTVDNELYLFRIKDNEITNNNDSAFLRLINLSPNSPLLSLTSSNNNGLFDEAEYLETSRYYPLEEGVYNFKLIILPKESISKNIRNINLQSERFYTIYILGLYNSTPPLGYLFVEDKK